MKLSTCNELPGTVFSVTTGVAMAVLKIELDDGPIITREAAGDLGLAEGPR